MNSESLIRNFLNDQRSEDARRELQARRHNERRSEGRLTLSEAESIIRHAGGKRAGGFGSAMVRAVREGTLPAYRPGVAVRYRHHNGQDLDRWLEVYEDDFYQWIGTEMPRLSILAVRQQCDVADVASASVTQRGTAQAQGAREDILWPVIRDVMKDLDTTDAGKVFARLNRMAANSEEPFTGRDDSGALLWRSSNNKIMKLTRKALGQRIARRKNHAKD